MTEKVLVLEQIQGRKVDADHGLAPERARDLARQFFRAYVHQVTVEGVYHADPHRGNVLLTTDGRLALVDFGLLGRLDDDTRRNLALLLLAVAQNRADDVADLILRFRGRASLRTSPASFRICGASFRAITGGRSRGFARARRWPTCNASPSNTASPCRRASPWWGRLWRKRTRSRASSTRSSTRSSCSRRTRWR